MASRHQKSDVLPDVLHFLAKAAAIVSALSLMYLVYLAFTGEFRFYPQGYNAATASAAVHMVELAGKALLVSSVILVLTLGYMYVTSPWYFGACVVMGIGLYVGLPYFAVPYLSDISRDITQRFHPGAGILYWWRAAGLAYAGGAGLVVVVLSIEQLQSALASSKRAGHGVRLPFYSACWQTHYCKEEINKYCAPGRKGFRKSCWRHKSGCFCDESIADRVMATARVKMGKDADKFLGPAARPPTPTFWDHFRSTHDRVPGQRLACADCPIYNFHEVQKHRLIAPIMILAIPALMYYKADVLHRGYAGFVNWLERFTMRAVFTPEGTAAISQNLRSALDVRGIEIMIMIVLGLLLVTIAARLLEWWCFELKL